MKKIAVFFFIVLFTSCKEVRAVPEGNTFYFETPQPINDSELKSFPKKFQGLYMDLDSVYLKINHDIITDEYFRRFKMGLQSFDSLKRDFIISENDIISKEFKDLKYTYRKLKDSIEITDYRIDTIFQFSDFQKAKRINGNIVISEKDSVYWNVKMLVFEKNKLTLKQLYSDSDLNNMDSITVTKSRKIDSTTFIISPKRNEFKQFFKLKNFGYDSNYKKIK